MLPEEGISLVNKFDGEFPKRFLPELLKYLSINKKDFPKASGMFEEKEFSESYLNNLCNNFRSPHLWYYENNKWHLRNKLKLDL